MKKLLIAIPALVLFMASCGSGDECDTSTAKGAAECYCAFEADLKAAKEADDEDKLKELKSEMDKFKKEAEKHMEAGDYSENDVEKHINEICEH